MAGRLVTVNKKDLHPSSNRTNCGLEVFVLGQLFVSLRILGLEVGQEFLAVGLPFLGVGADFPLGAVINKEFPDLFAFGVGDLAAGLAHHPLDVAVPHAAFNLPNRAVFEQLGVGFLESGDGGVLAFGLNEAAVKRPRRRMALSAFDHRKLVAGLLVGGIILKRRLIQFFRTYIIGIGVLHGLFFFQLGGGLLGRFAGINGPARQQDDGQCRG